MKTNFSRETINTYIYLKKPVINNESVASLIKQTLRAFSS